MKKTKREIIWEVLYTIIFGFLGYAIMDDLQKYNHNMKACDTYFNDLYNRVEALESPKEE